MENGVLRATDTGHHQLHAGHTGALEFLCLFWSDLRGREREHLQQMTMQSAHELNSSVHFEWIDFSLQERHMRSARLYFRSGTEKER